MKRCKESGKKYKIKFQTGPASAFATSAASSDSVENAAATAVPSGGGAADAAAEIPAAGASAGAAAEPAAGAAPSAEEELAAAAAEEAKRAEEAAAVAEVERLKSVANGECTFIYGRFPSVRVSRLCLRCLALVCDCCRLRALPQPIA